VSGDGRWLSLLCRVERRLCALPLAQVEEIMRPLPVEPVAGAPAFVLGVAVVRGEAVPVVDVAALLGAGGSHATRMVTMRVDGRRVALAVDAVLGVHAIEEKSLADLPPLLRVAGADAMSAVGQLDAELLVVLESARILPDGVWAALDAAREAGHSHP
jgi:purine-binding chemotaxis protein CheW